MIGIYKITSPSDGVYIGQSINIPKRWQEYRTMITVKGQPSLYRSFLKYGINEHKFDVIHELPNDTQRTILDEYEILYIDQYRKCGAKMLNIKGGGSNGRHCDETKLKISLIKKSKRLKHSEEARAKIKLKRSLQNNVKGVPKGNVPWNKGLKGVQVSHMKGKNHSEETKAKLREANIGKSTSEETRKKLSDNNPRYWKGKRFSEEHRQKLSQARIGKPSNNRIS